jgi:hypothetical protein
MQLNPSEISELLKSRIQGLGISHRTAHAGQRRDGHRRHLSACTDCRT